jgi:hypothetical protein
MIARIWRTWVGRYLLFTPEARETCSISPMSRPRSTVVQSIIEPPPLDLLQKYRHKVPRKAQRQTRLERCILLGRQMRLMYWAHKSFRAAVPSETT